MSLFPVRKDMVPATTATAAPVIDKLAIKTKCDAQHWTLTSKISTGGNPPAQWRR